MQVVNCICKICSVSLFFILPDKNKTKQTNKKKRILSSLICVLLVSNLRSKQTTTTTTKKSRINYDRNKIKTKHMVFFQWEYYFFLLQI